VTFDVTTVGDDGVLAITEHGACDYRGLLMQ
jgi:hypothetical protein